MSNRPLWRRALDKYQEEGAAETARATRQYLRRESKSLLIESLRNTPIDLDMHLEHYWEARARYLSVDTYQIQNRSDNRERWQLIEPYIDANDRFAFDIGCADGYFSSKLADEGLFTTGVDRTDPSAQQRLATARALYGSRPGLVFHAYEVTPTSIHNLPSADVTLLLTVYHHWSRIFGREEADKMLREVFHRSDKLFFEPPGKDSEKLTYIFDDYNESEKSRVEIREDYRSMLSSTFPDSVEISYLGEAEYRDSSPRTDPVFLIQ